MQCFPGVFLEIGGRNSRRLAKASWSSSNDWATAQPAQSDFQSWQDGTLRQGLDILEMGRDGARWNNVPTEVVIFKRSLSRSVRWTDVTMKCHSVTENMLSPKRNRHGHVGIVDAQAQWKWSARYPSGRTASGWFHVLLFGFLPKFGALTWLIDTSCPNIGNCPSRTRSPQRHPFGRGWLWLGCTRVLRCAEYSMPLYLKTWVTIEEMRSDHSIWIPVWKSIYNIHLNVFAVYSLWLVQLSNRAAIYKYTYTTVDAFT